MLIKTLKILSTGLFVFVISIILTYWLNSMIYKERTTVVDFKKAANVLKTKTYKYLFPKLKTEKFIPVLKNEKYLSDVDALGIAAPPKITSNIILSDIIDKYERSSVTEKEIQPDKAKIFHDKNTLNSEDHFLSQSKIAENIMSEVLIKSEEIIDEVSENIIVEDDKYLCFKETLSILINNIEFWEESENAN